jgi:hypothetical protein
MQLLRLECGVLRLTARPGTFTNRSDLLILQDHETRRRPMRPATVPMRGFRFPEAA